MNGFDLQIQMTADWSAMICLQSHNQIHYCCIGSNEYPTLKTNNIALLVKEHV